ncbi:MAG: thioredoxin domain-containing protein [Alphaproteobacteria bacterium]|nr:thioredoxin domain-containing protein [Alphaproteobacteria bacterium]
MILKRMLAAVAGTALLCSALPAGALAMDRPEVEKIVREYLLANPEILNEMIAELQKREEASSAKQAKDGIASNHDAIYNDGYSYVAGNPNGDVTLVEFFDYHCGYCKKVRPEVVQLLKDDSGVRLVLKEFPILGKVSEEAARAAIASLNQGGDHYWNFHQAMLAEDSLDSAGIYEIAANQGLDVERLKKDMADPSVQQKIDKNRELAKSIGIDGTPAFIMGDKLAPGAMSLEDMKAMIEAQRSGG